MTLHEPLIIVWLRRDLRLDDNAALYHALRRAAERGARVMPLFIFDRTILDALPNKRDRRVEFIHAALCAINTELARYGSSLLVRHGTPLEVWELLFGEYAIVEAYANHDYEPYAQERDNAIAALCQRKGVLFRTFKDQVVFEKGEVATADNRPYTVFTPYSKKWKSLLNNAALIQAYPTEEYAHSFWQTPSLSVPTLESLGFLPSVGNSFPEKTLRQNIIRTYDKTRDFPADEHGTTRLSVHLRFGTISIRSCVRAALQLNETWLNELIWRDFYMSILWHFPHVIHSAFKPNYDRIPWRQSDEDFERWRTGTTGYPLVDAGMRELNATGYMHNRVRMVTASFLAKHLLIDWRRGEQYFAEHLLDFDLAANNGGWQWAASTGCDAAPYFRIFNPTAQMAKFDPDGEYVNRWVPELNSFSYPPPVVEHALARERALRTYKQALQTAE